MSTQARITSLEALETLRAALVVFVSKSKASVDGVRETVKRTRQWLQADQRTHWEGEIRRRRRALDQAVQELYSARLTKMTATITMREAVVRLAKEAVEEAENKLRAVKRWSQNFDAASDPLVKKVESLRDYLEHNMTDAVTFLHRVRDILDAYTERSAPQAPPPAANTMETEALP